MFNLFKETLNAERLTMRQLKVAERVEKCHKAGNSFPWLTSVTFRF